MAWLQVMSATLIAEITSAEAFAAAAREWLAETSAEVFPDLYEGVRTRPVVRVRPRPKGDLDSPLGQPDHVLGELAVYRKHPAFDRREVLYSPESWQRVLAGLDEYPFAVGLSLHALDDRGFPRHQSRAQVRVERDFYAPDWTTFTFTAPAQDTGWPGSMAVQDRWAEFVKRQAGQVGACAGSMTDDIGPGQFALQRVTGNALHPISDSREVLLGYSWITVVAAELAARLGGAAALTASGAFYDVSSLPNGSLWLRATPSINEFTGQRVRRVFEALAPVLLTGVAEFEWGESYRLVESGDAANCRSVS